MEEIEQTCRPLACEAGGVHGRAFAVLLVGLAALVGGCADTSGSAPGADSSAKSIEDGSSPAAEGDDAAYTAVYRTTLIEAGVEVHEATLVFTSTSPTRWTAVVQGDDGASSCKARFDEFVWEVWDQDCVAEPYQGGYILSEDDIVLVQFPLTVTGAPWESWQHPERAEKVPVQSLGARSASPLEPADLDAVTAYRMSHGDSGTVEWIIEADRTVPSWVRESAVAAVRELWLESISLPRAALEDVPDFVRVGIEKESAAVGGASEYHAPKR